MSAHLESTVSGLVAAIQAARLYGPDHAAAREALASAHSRLAECIAADGPLAIFAVGSRILAAGGSIRSGAMLDELLIQPLRRRGVTSIRFLPALSLDECRRLVSAAAAGLDGIDLAQFSTIEFGGLTVAGAAPAPAPPPPSAHPEASAPNQLVDALRESDSAVRDDGSVDVQVVDRIATSICAAVVGAGGAILELARLKSYDEYTFVHTVNVAMLAAALSEACGLGPDRTFEITLAALLHDVGKRAVPIELLRKNAPLTDDELRIMQRHPVDGARMLIGLPDLPDAIPVVAFEHHMHIDGTGYPARPRGWRPNLASLIVQQADVFDAMRTHRPYRAAMEMMKAVAVLHAGAGVRYDRDLVETFLLCIASRVPANCDPLPIASTDTSADRRAAA